MNNEYRVMNDEQVSNFQRFGIEKVTDWHDRVNPDYVILTETSAFQFGWLFRESWRTFYGNENTPKFFRMKINPYIRSFSNGQFDRLQKYFKDRNMDLNRTILIYDELSQKPDITYQGYFRDRLESAQEIVRSGRVNEDAIELRTASNTLERTAKWVYELGAKNIWTDIGMPEDDGWFYLGDRFSGYYYSKGDRWFIKPTRSKPIIYSKMICGLEKDPEFRRRSLDYIHDLKLAGRNVS